MSPRPRDWRKARDEYVYLGGGWTWVRYTATDPGGRTIERGPYRYAEGTSKPIQAAAYLHAVEQVARIRAGRPPERRVASQSLASYAREWRARRGAASTRRTWLAQARRWMDGPLGARDIRSPILLEDMAELVGSLADLAPSTQARTIATLRAVGAQLVAEGVWERNYAVAAPDTARADDRRPELRLTPEVMPWSAVAAVDDEATAYYALLWTSGMRRAEISDLIVDELDLGDEPRILLPASRTKERRAKAVPVASWVADLVAAHIARRVITSGRVWSVTATTWSNRFGRLMDAAGHSGYRQHSVRGGVIATLGALGVRPAVVSTLVGHRIDHSTSAMTSHYDGPTPGEMREAVEVLAERVRAAAMGTTMGTGHDVDPHETRVTQGDS